MEKYKVIRGNTEDEVWGQLGSDLESISYPFVYGANIEQGGRSVNLAIEVDLGGGFESGMLTTSLTAPVPVQFTTLSSRVMEHKDFRFALHDEDFIDKLGKFFGMEDVQTGFAEFDKKLIVKTNDVETVKAVFSDEETRRVFQELKGFNLHLAYYDHDDRHSALEFTINRDITNVQELHRIYNAFVNVLKAFEYNHSPVLG